MRGMRYIRKHIGTRGLACFCVVDFLFCLSSMGIALLLSALLDAATAAVAVGDVSPVVRLALTSCLYALVLGALRLASDALRALIVRDAMVNIREGAARGIIAGASCGRVCDSAEQLTVLGQNMDVLENDCITGSLGILESVFQITIGCIMLVLINPLVALISLAGMALPTLVPQLFGKRLSCQQQQVVEDAKSYNGRVRDTAQGGEVIRSFHVEQHVLDKLSGMIGRYQRHKADLNMTMACARSLASVVGIAMQFCIMGMTGVFAIWGYVTIGSIVAVTQLSGSVISPATELSDKISKLKSTYPILDRLDKPSDTPGARQEIAVCEPRRSIELDDVSFSYGDTDPAEGRLSNAPTTLRNCSKRFDAGKKYAIVGKSGCGKSTLLELLGGSLRPSSGHVLVDGRAGCVPDAAWVHQNVFLFDDTLRENIGLGGTFTDEQIGSALRLAGLDEVIAALPDGLDTPVGEGGGRLSGGERQRVAIARALLYGKTTLLVDEATSALDKETAARVEDTLLALDGVTLIAVTHQLDAEHAARYDEVLEMKDGRLAAM
ncbi:ATP-binding cassette domain-containing protein [Olsenella phocaeensis]|uniref:ATP-binding cassette domain-containing protein n=1 Tax=Olsenella phocaeensis TaxID=1852385 RepID=UPI000ADCA630|nr:ATP-binding cassette domain-containing protein [Olsenella phocaeensis]